MLVLIIDCQPPYLRAAGSAASLLTLPHGTHSLLWELSRRTADLRERELVVLTPLAGNEAYLERIRRSGGGEVSARRPADVAFVLDSCESRDFVLVVDPSRWPSNGFDLARAARVLGGYQGVSNAIAVGAKRGHALEQVDCDPNGCVRRVQRLYQGVTWVEGAGEAVFLTVAPARFVARIEFASLAQLRFGLSHQGVLSRDVPVESDLLDLNEEAGLLALNERLLAGARSPPGCGLGRRAAGGLWVGAGCRIDPCSRLIGPAIVQDGVTIGAGATVIGPSVLGRNSVVHRGAIVAQAVLAEETTVPAGACVRHRVVGNGWAHAAGVTCEEGAEDSTSPASVDESAIGEMDDVVGRARSCDRRNVHLLLQRVMDLVLACLALVLLAPLLVLVAILIKLESPGPVFFAHRREQRGGKEFSCVKFRTMVAGAHRRQRELYRTNEVDGPQFKIRRDPRVTRVGSFLRALNIDELPQLFNVLAGHMSLVGPRPSPFRENQICIPWRQARLSVRPGITGLWQLCRDDGRAGQFHQWIHYDLLYVRHFSIWLDIKVLLATAVTLGGRWRVPVTRLIPRASEGGGAVHEAVAA